MAFFKVFQLQNLLVLSGEKIKKTVFLKIPEEGLKQLINPNN